MAAGCSTSWSHTKQTRFIDPFRPELVGGRPTRADICSITPKICSCEPTEAKIASVGRDGNSCCSSRSDAGLVGVNSRSLWLAHWRSDDIVLWPDGLHAPRQVLVALAYEAHPGGWRSSFAYGRGARMGLQTTAQSGQGQAPAVVHMSSSSP